MTSSDFKLWYPEITPVTIKITYFKQLDAPSSWLPA